VGSEGEEWKFPSIGEVVRFNGWVDEKKMSSKRRPNMRRGSYLKTRRPGRLFLSSLVAKLCSKTGFNPQQEMTKKENGGGKERVQRYQGKKRPFPRKQKRGET